MAKLQIEIEINDKGTPVIRQLGQATADTGKQAEEASRGVAHLGQKVDTATTSVTNLLNPVALLNVAIGAGIVAALKSAVGEATQFADEIHRLRLLTGSSVRDLAALVDVANDVGIEFGAVQMALLHLANQSDETDGVLAQLNLTAKDGVGRLVQFAQKLAGVTDANQRAAIASEVFGARIAAGLLPLVDRLKNGMVDLGAETNDFADILGDDGVTALRNFGIAQGQVGDALLALKIVVAKDLLPVMGPLVAMTEQTVKWFYAVPAPVRAAVEVLGLAAGVITAVNIALRLFGITTLAMSGPAGWIALAVAGIAVLVTSLEGLGSKLTSLWTDFKNRGMTPAPAPSTPGVPTGAAPAAPVILPKDVLEANAAVKKQIDALKAERLELEQGKVAALQYTLAHGEMAKASPALKAQLVALTQGVNNLKTAQEIAADLQAALTADTKEATEAILKNVEAVKAQNNEVALSTLAEAVDELNEIKKKEKELAQSVRDANTEIRQQNLLFIDAGRLAGETMEEFEGTVARTKELLQWEQERIDLQERLKQLSPAEAEQQRNQALQTAIARMQQYKIDLKDEAGLVERVDREILKLTADQAALNKTTLTFGDAVEKAFGGILDILSLFGVKVGKFILLLQNLPRAIGGLREIFAGLGGLMTLGGTTLGAGTAWAETAKSVTALGNASGQTAGVLGFFQGALSLATQALPLFAAGLTSIIQFIGAAASGNISGGAGGIGSLLSTLSSGLSGITSVLQTGIGSITGIFNVGLAGVLPNAGTLGPAFGGAAGLLQQGMGFITQAAPWIGAAYSLFQMFKGQLSPMSGALQGAAIGTMFLPGIGTAIGAIVGTIAGFISKLFGAPEAYIKGNVQLKPTTIEELLAAKRTAPSEAIYDDHTATLDSGPFAAFVKKRHMSGVGKDDLIVAFTNIVIDTLQAAVQGIQTLSTKLPSKEVGALISQQLNEVLAEGFEITRFDVDNEDKAKVIKQFNEYLTKLPGDVLTLLSGKLFGDIDIKALGGGDAVKGFEALANSIMLTSQILDRAIPSTQAYTGTLEDFAHASVDFVNKFKQGEETFEQTTQRLSQSFGQLFAMMDALPMEIAGLTNDTGAAISLMIERYQQIAEGMQSAADALTVAVESGASPEEVVAAAQAVKDSLNAQMQALQAIVGVLQSLNSTLSTSITLFFDLDARIGQLGGTLSSLDSNLAGLEIGMSLLDDVGAQIVLFGGVLRSSVRDFSTLTAAVPALGAAFNQILANIRAIPDASTAMTQLKALADAVSQGFALARQNIQAAADTARSAAQAAADARIQRLNEERDVILKTQDAERDALNETLEAAREWESVAQSVKAQLVDLFNLLAPTHPQTSLSEIQAQFREAFAAFQANPSVTGAEQVQQLAQQLLQLAQQTPGYDLPSDLFQALAAEVQAALEAIKVVAEGQPSTEDLLGQIAELDEQQQIQLEAIDAQIAETQADLQAALQQIAADEQAQLAAIDVGERVALEMIRDEVAKRVSEVALQLDEAQKRLQELTGGLPLQEFMANKQAETVNVLRGIDDTLRRYLGAIVEGLGLSVGPPYAASPTPEEHIFGNYGGVPSYQQGTAYVPRTGLALLHQGEQVVPTGRTRTAGKTEVAFSAQITVHAGAGTNGRQVAEEIKPVLLEWLDSGPVRHRVQELAKGR